MTQLENICFRITKDLALETGKNDVPTCGADEVLVHVKCTGVCGSDIHLWKHGHIGDLTITEDLIIGHECAGQVLQVGLNVGKELKVGDKVAIEPQVPCGKCFLCVEGDYNLCSNVDFFGIPGMPGREPSYNGSMQRYRTVKAQFAHKIPDTMTYEEGALVEVFSVAYHGIEKAGGLELGKPCMVAGCGPIGLATIVLADAAGAYPIVVTDVSESRLKFAKELVPTLKTYQIQTKLDAKENATEIRKLFGTEEAEMPPYVLECTGVESSINTCCYVTRRRGCLTILGVCAKNEINNFPFMPLSFGEVEVRFINRYKNSWPPVINLIGLGKIDVKKFVTHKFSLENAAQALHAVVDPNMDTIKVMVVDDVQLS